MILTAISCSTNVPLTFQFWFIWLWMKYALQEQLPNTAATNPIQAISNSGSKTLLGLTNLKCHHHYLFQWALAACLGFLLHFRTRWSFDERLIIRVGPATYKYQTGRKIRNPRTPSTMQACSFFSNLFLKFCFSTPAFSSTILLHKFVQVFDTLKIPVHCFGTWNTLKKVICLILSYTLFLLLGYFISIWTYKLMTSLIINLSFAVLYWQSISCETIDKSQGDLNSSNSKYSPLCPPWSISVALLLFEASTSIFCVLIRQLLPLS